LKKNNGFTLVEALVAMAIVLFIVVSILSGFTQQMVSNRYAGGKNVAISLAESKMEEYLKFPASQMPASSVDYVVERGRRLVVSNIDLGVNDQYRRTTAITMGEVGTLLTIQVMVEYGNRGAHYPFRVVLTSRRGG
jgi:type II secretion system protein I